MGFYTDNIVAPGTKIYALVELDDYATTHSTGGCVVKIYWILPGSPDMTPWTTDYDWSSGNFKTVEITDSDDEVKIGWIYADKTGILRDQNS